MLTELYIRNLTLIEELTLSFGPGLTVLTGETGAGKSILLDAIFLAIGGRASADVIREGAIEVDVSARFFVNEKVRARISKVIDNDSSDDRDLLLRRVVSRSGRHRQYVNGMPVTVSQLKEIAEPLIDFTGQHAQHALLASKGQMGLLDAYASHELLLKNVSKAYENCKALHAEKAQLDVDERTRANRLEWLRFQIDEIEKCKPSKGELDLLVAERERLINVARVREESSRLLCALSDGEANDDISSRLLLAVRSLQALRRFDSTFAECEKHIEEATNLIDQVCSQVNKYAQNLEENPERLTEVEDRIGDIKQLMRKHGDTVEEVLAALLSMQTEVRTLESSDERLEEIEKKLAYARTQMLDGARTLSQSRQKAAQRLAPLVKKEVSDLGMPGAIFEMELRYDENNINASGADTLRMLFSANPGENPNALEKVASGGELSRVMLAIKRVLMSKDATMVSIFDEVDAGVGGAIGHAIGEKLKAISKGRQVLCVTHLAQVAALADAHMKVEKKVVKGRTFSNLQALSRAQRVDELARMMGGKEVTALTRKHADEFLEQAGVTV